VTTDTETVAPGLTHADRTRAGSAERARAFLRRLASPGEVLAKRVALVVAHPDDEALSLGAQLPRLKGLTIVHVTDGAPRGDLHGFGTREDYAAARRAELAAAVALTGIGADALIGFGVPDQEAALDLAGTARRLGSLLAGRGIEVVLTHAYEGGHPDHDAVAFAAHAACRLAAATGEPPGLIEMPFYHAGRAGWIRQRFTVEGGPPELALRLQEADRALKQRMYDAHATQRETLASFPPEWERFRVAPAHDFTALPNGGDLLYERYGWGMTGARWRELSGGALLELGLSDAR
jgi:LmbE family N-acetylglucosaminyl deacetylase